MAAEPHQGLFVNLRSSEQRRDAMLRQFADVGAADRYRRFDAVDGRAVAAQYATRLSPGELGVWLSTVELLRQNVDAPAHLHVVEDDIVFARNAVTNLDQLLPAIDARHPDWDLLFTEAFVSPDPFLFREFADHVRAFRTTRTLSVVPLVKQGFGGLTSYVVNRRSIGKMLGLLERGWESNRAVDIHVRGLVWDGSLRGYVTVPFLTTLSPHNDVSDIRGSVDDSRRVLDFIRRAFYVDADVPALVRQLLDRNRDAKLDDLSTLLVQVMTSLMSPEWSRF